MYEKLIKSFISQSIQFQEILKKKYDILFKYNHQLTKQNHVLIRFNELGHNKKFFQRRRVDMLNLNTLR